MSPYSCLGRALKKFSTIILRQGDTFSPFIAFALFLASVPAVFASGWCWDPVELSCSGQPAQVLAYDVLVSWLHPTFADCQIVVCGPDCSPTDPLCCSLAASICVTYTRTAWSVGVRVLTPDTCTGWDPAVPETLGEVVLINVVAETAGGLGPMDSCP